jgi:hypothetical protein
MHLVDDHPYLSSENNREVRLTIHQYTATAAFTISNGMYSTKDIAWVAPTFNHSVMVGPGMVRDYPIRLFMTY